MRGRKLVVLAVSAMALVGVAIAPTASAAVADGQKHCGSPVNGVFEKATPEEVGLSSEKLREAAGFAASRGTLSFRVYRNGCEVFVGPYDGLVSDIPRNNFSHTKTVLALSALRAQQLGIIDIDEPIGEYVPETAEDVDPVKLTITTRQLLEMSSGMHTQYVWPETAAPDGVEIAYADPQDHAPGTFWEYNQIPLNLVPHVIESALGGDVDYQDWVQKEMFEPLGIPRDSWFWLRDRVGHTLGSHHLFSSPRHMALIGALMDGEGTVGGRELIAKGLYDELIKPLDHIGQPSYGLLTWLNSGDSYKTVGTICTGDATLDRPLIESAPRDMYFSYGWRGIHTYEIPSLNMSVVQTTAPDAITADVLDTAQSVCSVEMGEFYHEFWRKVSAAVMDAPQPDPGPWHNPQPVRAPLDPELFTDQITNGDLSRSIAVGPWAPKGCSPAGCDGKLYYEGYAKLSREAITAISASLVRTLANITAGEEAGAALMGPDTLLPTGDVLGAAGRGVVERELAAGCQDFRAGKDPHDVLSERRANVAPLGGAHGAEFGNAFTMAMADALPAFCTA
ncbi:serine hydrolase domain-containing protein [Pseudonocardia xishanensis]|uniref:Beta-lactamase-related domain-containing protein n=1 Tax=Pseudonocardia xishanensis TaxID=630995 RepID=A0ABP8RV22_9PSEU